MLSNPIELFDYLLKKNIGTEWSLFYEARALVQEKFHKLEDASETYQMGIKNKAKPVDRLQTNYLKFKERVAKSENASQKELPINWEGEKLLQKRKTLESRNSSSQSITVVCDDFTNTVPLQHCTGDENELQYEEIRANYYRSKQKSLETPSSSSPSVQRSAKRSKLSESNTDVSSTLEKSPSLNRSKGSSKASPAKRSKKEEKQEKEKLKREKDERERIEKEKQEQAEQERKLKEERERAEKERMEREQKEKERERMEEEKRKEEEERRKELEREEREREEREIEKMEKEKKKVLEQLVHVKDDLLNFGEEEEGNLSEMGDDQASGLSYLEDQVDDGQEEDENKTLVIEEPTGYIGMDELMDGQTRELTRGASMFNIMDQTCNINDTLHTTTITSNLPNKTLTFYSKMAHDDLMSDFQGPISDPDEPEDDLDDIDDHSISHTGMSELNTMGGDITGGSFQIFQDNTENVTTSDLSSDFNILQDENDDHPIEDEENFSLGRLGMKKSDKNQIFMDENNENDENAPLSFRKKKSSNGSSGKASIGAFGRPANGKMQIYQDENDENENADADFFMNDNDDNKIFQDDPSEKISIYQDEPSGNIPIYQDENAHSSKNRNSRGSRASRGSLGRQSTGKLEIYQDENDENTDADFFMNDNNDNKIFQDDPSEKISIYRDEPSGKMTIYQDDEEEELENKENKFGENRRSENKGKLLEERVLQDLPIEQNLEEDFVVLSVEEKEDEDALFPAMDKENEIENDFVIYEDPEEAEPSKSLKDRKKLLESGTLYSELDDEEEMFNISDEINPLIPKLEETPMKKPTRATARKSPRKGRGKKKEDDEEFEDFATNNAEEDIFKLSEDEDDFLFNSPPKSSKKVRKSKRLSLKGKGSPKKEAPSPKASPKTTPRRTSRRKSTEIAIPLPSLVEEAPDSETQVTPKRKRGRPAKNSPSGKLTSPKTPTRSTPQRKTTQSPRQSKRVLEKQQKEEEEEEEEERGAGITEQEEIKHVEENEIDPYIKRNCEKLLYVKKYINFMQQLKNKKEFILNGNKKTPKTIPHLKKALRKVKNKIDDSEFAESSDLFNQQSISVGPCIGQGGNAKVFVVYHTMNSGSHPTGDDSDEEYGESTVTPTNMTLKALKHQINSDPVAMRWEFYILKQIENRLCSEISNFKISFYPYNYMKFRYCTGYYLHEFQDSSFLLMSYHDQGTLLNLINIHRTKSLKIDEILVAFYSLEVLSILYSLHKCSIIHGDIKPDNFLIMNKNSIYSDDWEDWNINAPVGWESRGLQLIDFGRALDLKCYKNKGNQLFIGDNHVKEYQSVEMRNKKPWSYQIDIFGACFIIHMLLHLQPLDIVQKKPSRLAAKSSSVDANKMYWLPKEAPKRYWVHNWDALFTDLLNISSNESCLPLLETHIGELQKFLAPTKNSRQVRVALSKENQLLHDNGF